MRELGRKKKVKLMVMGMQRGSSTTVALPLFPVSVNPLFFALLQMFSFFLVLIFFFMGQEDALLQSIKRTTAIIFRCLFHSRGKNEKVEKHCRASEWKKEERERGFLFG